MRTVFVSLALLLAAATQAAAECEDIGRLRFCDGLRPYYRPWYLDKVEPTVRPKQPYRYELRSRTYRTRYGTTWQTYRFKDNRVNRTTGSTTILPNSTVIHRGSSKR